MKKPETPFGGIMVKLTKGPKIVQGQNSKKECYIMKVNLISYTQATEELKLKGIINLQELIAHGARVSNPANQFNTETSGKLITYLIKNQHWSPLEVVNVCLEIETTRAIARQILRHRSFSFQEFSQRYAVANMEWDFQEARMQDEKNRQNSLNTDNELLKKWWDENQRYIAEIVEDTYQTALKNGIAKEQARSILPEGLTVSKLYMNGSMRSWVHYISLRTQKGTQKEHRDVALACAEAIKPIFPMIGEFVSE